MLPSGPCAETLKSEPTATCAARTYVALLSRTTFLDLALPAVLGHPIDDSGTWYFWPRELADEDLGVDDDS